MNIRTVEDAAGVDYRNRIERLRPQLSSDGPMTPEFLGRLKEVDSGFIWAAAKAQWVCESAPALLEGETAAITFASPKTCSLIYDRIWGGSTWWLSGVPADVVFGCRTPAEQTAMTAMCMTIASSFYLAPGDDRLARLNEDLTPDRIRRAKPNFLGELGGVCSAHEVTHRKPISLVMHGGIGAKPLHEEGDSTTVVSVLRGLPFFDEAELDWEQVIEFRRDSERKTRVRQFLRWLDGGFIGKSVSEIQDELGSRVEEYRADLRTHGLATKLSTVEAFYLAAPGVTAAIEGALASAILAGSGVALSVALGKWKLGREREALRRKNRDVALAIAVAELFNSPAGQPK